MPEEKHNSWELYYSLVRELERIAREDFKVTAFIVRLDVSNGGLRSPVKIETQTSDRR